MRTFRPQLFVLCGCVAGASLARAVENFTVNLSSVTTTVPGGGSAPFTITGLLSNNDANLGLAYFVLDLQMSGPATINLSQAVVQAAPSSGAMDSFVPPLGYALNYTGTPVGDELAQCGGAQNTINNNPAAPPFEPFPSGAVVLNVGHGVDGVVLLEGTLTFPEGIPGGDYTLSVKPGSLFANLIVSFDGSNYGLSSVDGVIGTPLTITIAACHEASDVNFDGFTNVTDALCLLDTFAGLGTSPACEDPQGLQVPLSARDIAPCPGGDGVVNVDDVLADLDAFAGLFSCCE